MSAMILRVCVYIGARSVYAERTFYSRQGLHMQVTVCECVGFRCVVCVGDHAAPT